MKKAVLLMDVPETCLDCNLCVLDTDGSISCYYTKIEICSNVGENNSRPHWCPLRPLPDRKEITETYKWEDRLPSFKCGWNWCLDEITGGKR